MDNPIILIVDDMRSMRAITKKILHMSGYTKTLECENGKQALNRLKTSKVDIVLCDWDMPIMTGVELLEAAKSNERLSKIPFIMLTANADREFVTRCINLKANGYIIKPFQPNALIEKIKSIL